MSGSISVGTGGFKWTHAVFYVFFVVITPVYLLILLCLLKLRRSVLSFQSTFYTLLVQQGIADLTSLISFVLERFVMHKCSAYLFYHQGFYVPAVIFNTLFWFTIIRSYGVALMTVQRYLIIVKPSKAFTEFIRHLAFWKIWLLYWIPPSVFNFFFFWDADVHFEDPEVLNVVVPLSIVDSHSRTTMIFVSTSSLACTLFYVLIAKFVRENSRSMSKSMRREYRLALQVLILLLAQLVFFVYMAFQNAYANSGNTEMIMYVRGFYPLVNGLLSFVSPFIIVLFNRDLSQRIKTMLKQKADRSRDTSTVFSMGSGRPEALNKFRSVADLIKMTSMMDGKEQRVVIR